MPGPRALVAGPPLRAQRVLGRGRSPTVLVRVMGEGGGGGGGAGGGPEGAGGGPSISTVQVRGEARQYSSKVTLSHHRTCQVTLLHLDEQVR